MTKKNKVPINVTRPLIPDFDKYSNELRKVWKAGFFTNNGPNARKLEKQLENYLGVENLVLYNNGTNALLAAMYDANISGEVITTPFTFAATSNSACFLGKKVRFSDVDAETFNLDPYSVEKDISDETCAIAPVACYGNISGFHQIRDLCDKHNLKMIADCAHCFGVQYSSNVYEIADYSILSFHATKVFSTVEGGAVITKTQETANRLREIRNFGIISEKEINSIGINGKMSELHAIFGLLSLEIVDKSIERRLEIKSKYQESLSAISKIFFQKMPDNFQDNGAYMPIKIDGDIDLRDRLYDFLKEHDVNARKYFYPLANTVNEMHHEWGSFCLPTAKKLSESILCLPIYDELQDSEVEYICALICEFFQ